MSKEKVEKVIGKLRENNFKCYLYNVTGNYAFLMESTSIEYVIERNCELTQVGSMLDSKGYGIAMPPSKCFDEKI